MKIDNEHSYILLCKMGFSDVLESIISKNFLGASPQTPHFLVTCLLDRNILTNTLLPIEADMYTYKRFPRPLTGLYSCATLQSSSAAYRRAHYRHYPLDKNIHIFQGSPKPQFSDLENTFKTRSRKIDHVFLVFLLY